jgi:WD40 repeat protein
VTTGLVALVMVRFRLGYFPVCMTGPSSTSCIASGLEDNNMCIWNVVMGESEAKLKGHSGQVHSVVFSPDGTCVVSGSADNTICIWNVATDESEAELKGHFGMVYSVVFSPDGCCLVSGLEDNTVHIWNVATAESEAELKGHSGKVYSVIFSPDGSHVVSGSEDNTVHIWTTAMGLSSVLADDSLVHGGIYVFHCPRDFHISPPLLPTEMSSIPLDSPWIVHTASGLQCWIQNFRLFRSGPLVFNDILCTEFICIFLLSLCICFATICIRKNRYLRSDSGCRLWTYSGVLDTMTIYGNQLDMELSQVSGCQLLILHKFCET